MSEARELIEAVERDVAAISEKRWVTTVEAGLIAESHPETVRKAARAGELHGVQLEGISAKTGKPKRGGTWKFRPACVDAWVEGVPCKHIDKAASPVSLDSFRMRAVGGIR